MTKQLDLDLAAQGRDTGIKRAVDHANRVTPDWQAQAFGLFAEYCKLNKGKTFMTEDARWFAEERGLPAPPDKRAWGGITTMARSAKLIRGNGYAPQKSVNAHCAPKTVWVAL